MHNTQPRSIVFNCYVYFLPWIWTRDLFSQPPIAGYFGLFLCYNKYPCMGFYCVAQQFYLPNSSPINYVHAANYPKFSNINWQFWYSSQILEAVVSWKILLFSWCRKRTDTPTSPNGQVVGGNPTWLEFLGGILWEWVFPLWGLWSRERPLLPSNIVSTLQLHSQLQRGLQWPISFKTETLRKCTCLSAS